MWLATRKKIGLLVLAAVFLPGAVYADETLTKQQGDAILAGAQGDPRAAREAGYRPPPRLRQLRPACPLPDRKNATLPDTVPAMPALGANGRARHDRRVHRPAVPLLRAVQQRRRFRGAAARNTSTRARCASSRATCRSSFHAQAMPAARRGALRGRAGQVLGVPRAVVRAAEGPGAVTLR